MSRGRCRLPLALLALGTVGSCVGSPDPSVVLGRFGPRPGTIAQRVQVGGPNPAPVAVSVTNAGSCPLAFSAQAQTSDGNAWLTVSPPSGNLAPGAGTDLTVSIDVVAPGLQQGTYTGSVRVSGTCIATGEPAVGSPVLISVNLTVLAISAGLVVGNDTIEEDVVSLADAWSGTNAGGPAARLEHVAVWTGSRMVVWGGRRAFNDLTSVVATGGDYEPNSDSWSPTSGSNAPLAVRLASAVWTGSRMIVWGGHNGTANINSGKAYDPATDTWFTINGAPVSLSGHAAVWSGSVMIVWKGNPPSGAKGAKLDPAATLGGAWTTINSTGSPDSDFATAVWTGTEMLVWGDDPALPGAAYDLAQNQWSPIPTGGGPGPRGFHTAVWTGKEMIVWGGTDGTDDLGTGFRYDPARKAWSPVATTGAPAARRGHSAAWTGSRLIVWGGLTGLGLDPGPGAVYDPATDTWAPLSTAGAPGNRVFHTSVWTGAEMIVWGGTLVPGLDPTTGTGGRYR